MNGAPILVPVVALVWAGVTIGGSLIAAPAKFAAPSLDLRMALEVGHEQFFWIWIAERALCAALIGVLVFRPPLARWWLAAPILVFALQQLVLMPLLDARTVRIIAGETVPESPLHLVFAVLESVKVAALIAAGVIALRCTASPGAHSRRAS